MSKPYLLGIDQGTSGSRALVMDKEGEVCGYAYRPLARIHPRSGWVEQDPQAVAAGVAEVIAEALVRAGCRPDEIAACGIACQRNTDFAWDARTGRPLANAITWQDLRTQPLAEALGDWALADQRRRRLGYFPGPYSSALHLAWRMRHCPDLRQAAAAGTLRFGLSAAWLIVALGRPTGHQMDYSLVQAMGLYDFRARRYWPEWLERLAVPLAALPAATATVHDFGVLRIAAPGGATVAAPVLATIGDQQAALLGYGCHQPGQAECTHGTASFVDVFLGHEAPDQESINVYFAWCLPEQFFMVEKTTTGHENQPAAGDHALFTGQGLVRPTYCLEADTAVTGAAIRWMRESARLFDRDEEVGPLAASTPDSGGVVFVPAFTGLNTPYHNHRARGAILGLTLSSTRAHIVRAFLESLGYQLRAILETVEAETGLRVNHLQLGGGVSASDEACQIQADLLGIPTVRPAFAETTSRAAALLAGLGAGFWRSPLDLPPLPGPRTVFEPRLAAAQRDEGYARWQSAVQRTLDWTRD